MPLKIKLDRNLKTLTSIPGWAEEYNTKTGGSAATAYLSSAWAFRSVNIRADAIASAPLLLMDGNDEEIDDHPVLDLLDRVNEEWNKGDLWRYTESAYCVYGSAFWQKVRAGSKIIELQFINPAGVDVKMSAAGIDGFIQKGITQRKWEREDVIYFRGSYDPGSDLSGIAPLKLAILAAMGEKSADQYMSAFFANYAVPPLLLTTDQPVTDSLVEKVSSWWKKMFQGPSNQFKTGVVGSGLKPVQLSSNMKDMALDTTRAEMHRTICVALGVDELLLSASGAADKTPVDAALYHLYTTTIIPRWSYYQEVLDAELIPEYPDLVAKNAYFEFDQSAVKPLQNDQNAWALTLATLVEKGILKPEVVAIELGYSEEDVPGVPEPAPIIVQAAPPQLPPQPTVPIPEAVVSPGDTTISTASIDRLELDKWCRKSINALKAGKSPSIDFISDKLSGNLVSGILEELELCKSEDEIKEVFRNARYEPTDSNGYKALARALNRATNLLELTGKEVNIQ
jgi:HK97 family phage portal protein